MILKLREAHISNLEKSRQDEGFSDLETETIVSTLLIITYVCVFMYWIRIVKINYIQVYI